MTENSIYKRNCPTCNKELTYCSNNAVNRANKNNRPCLQCTCKSIEFRQKMIDNKGKHTGENNPFYGKHHTDITKNKLASYRIGKKSSQETIDKITKSLIGNKYNLGKHLTIEHKKKISLNSKHLSGMRGKEHTEKSKELMSISHIGKHTEPKTEEHKRNLRISIMKRLEKQGYGMAIDKGSIEWFEKYNIENNTNYKPKRFMEIGYDADGYDEKLHSWIEYDTEYHKRITQKKRDLIRQNNIIKYFEEIGEPLVAFKRYRTWNNKLETVYRGYSY